MPVFMVRVRCDSIRANLEGETREYAFLKNQFLRAENADLAIKKAFARTREALKAKPAITPEDALSATLLVDLPGDIRTI